MLKILILIGPGTWITREAGTKTRFDMTAVFEYSWTHGECRVHGSCFVSIGMRTPRRAEISYYLHS